MRMSVLLKMCGSLPPLFHAWAHCPNCGFWTLEFQYPKQNSQCSVRQYANWCLWSPHFNRSLEVNIALQISSSFFSTPGRVEGLHNATVIYVGRFFSITGSYSHKLMSTKASIRYPTRIIYRIVLSTIIGSAKQRTDITLLPSGPKIRLAVDGSTEATAQWGYGTTLLNLEMCDSCIDLNPHLLRTDPAVQTEYLRDIGNGTTRQRDDKHEIVHKL